MNLQQRKIQFDETLTKISTILDNIGIKLNIDDYDGLILKKLGSSNTLVDGEQTNHIAISGKQMDIFPYLRPIRYLDDDDYDKEFKSYYVLTVPIFLTKSNCYYLKNKEKMPGSMDDAKIKSFATILRSKRANGSEQIEFSSQKGLDDTKLLEFRRLLSKNSFLIFLKRKKEVQYELFGVPGIIDSDIRRNDLNKLNQLVNSISNDETDFNKLNECEFLEKINDSSDLDKLKDELTLYELKDKLFYYYNKQNTATKTLITFESFKINRANNGENVLLYGVPGSGKSWTIENQYCDDESRIERVVFHPDYTYSDFIGQILPKIDDDEKVRYEFTPGPFTSILKKAHDDPQNKYFLIIEEINRGNAPAIFGDVFQLLDRFTEDNKLYQKGTSRYAITNPEIADKVYDDKNHKVRIESNLSIIATMNTSDQNVFTLDTAFQRRWNMRLIENSFDNVDKKFREKTILDTDVNWEKFCTEINDYILEKNSLFNSSEDKRLGVYFVSMDDLNHNKSTENISYCKFSEKVLKYLWDDAFKFNREDIFKSKFKSLEEVIKEFNSKNKNERLNIFDDDFIERLGIDSDNF